MGSRRTAAGSVPVVGSVDARVGTLPGGHASPKCRTSQRPVAAPSAAAANHSLPTGLLVTLWCEVMATRFLPRPILECPWWQDPVLTALPRPPKVSAAAPFELPHGHQALLRRLGRASASWEPPSRRGARKWRTVHFAGLSAEREPSRWSAERPVLGVDPSKGRPRR